MTFFRLFYSDFEILNEKNYEFFILIVLCKVLRIYKNKIFYEKFLKILENKLDEYKLEKDFIKNIFEIIIFFIKIIC